MGTNVRIAVVVAVSIWASGCTIAKVSGSAPRPIYFNNPTDVSYEIVKHFEKQSTVAFDYTNTYEIGTLVSEVIAETQADAVINLRTEIRFTVADYLFNLVTCGLASSKTMVVVGDAVKFKK